MKGGYVVHNMTAYDRAGSIGEPISSNKTRSPIPFYDIILGTGWGFCA